MLTDTDVNAIIKLLDVGRQKIIAEDTAFFKEWKARHVSKFGCELIPLTGDALLHNLQDLATYCQDDTSGVKEITFNPSNNYLSFLTEEIILEGINFGAFKVVIDLCRAAYAVTESYSVDSIDFVAQRPKNTDFPHPHIRCNRLCFGEGREHGVLKILGRNYFGFVTQVIATLRTYSSSNPHKSIGFYQEPRIRCKECRSTQEKSRAKKCSGCEEYHCNSCNMVKCGYCSRFHCSACTLLDVYKGVQDNKLYPVCRACLPKRVLLEDAFSKERFYLHLRDDAAVEDVNFSNDYWLEAIQKINPQKDFKDITGGGMKTWLMNSISPDRYLRCSTS